jgi:Pathogenicity locus
MKSPNSSAPIANSDRALAVFSNPARLSPGYDREMKTASLVDLCSIPGVGPSIASDLHLLGIRQVADLRGRDPQLLYSELCREMDQHVDRCVLYVFRCAVYFASEPKHDPELLKWWNWKDGTKAATKSACAKPKMNPNLQNLTRIRNSRRPSQDQNRTNPDRM